LGFFSNILERRDTTLLSNPAAWLYEAFGAVPTDSGISVSPESAMKYTAVYSCVNVLGQALAQVPWDVYRRKGEKGKEIARDRSEHYLLHSEPNGKMTSYSMRMAMMANVSLRGNMFVEIQRDGASRTRALRPLLASNVCVYDSLDDESLVYKVTRRNGTTDVLDGSDVIHVPCISLDGASGLSPIAQNRQAIGLGLAAEAAGASFFGNGSRPSGYLTSDKPIRQQDREDIEKKWFAKFGGSKNHGKVPVLSGGLKWNQLSISPSDAQYLETRNYQAADIARIFRVPAVLIGLADKTSTYASAEAFFQSFIMHTIVPWAVAIEQEFNRKLFPNTDDIYCKLDLNGLMRGDPKTRAEFYKSLFGAGALSQNDIRGWEEQDPIEGGDRYWIQQGFMPLDRADEIIDKQGSQPKALPASSQDSNKDQNRSAHVAWLEDVIARISKWERKDNIRALAAMEPVFRSLNRDGSRDIYAFLAQHVSFDEPVMASPLIDRFLDKVF
jgi:HK97 family phage portal protein